MQTSIEINIDKGNLRYILSGSTPDLLKNSRIVTTLKRLKYSLDGANILIPYEEETKIKTLQEIQAFLDKFSFNTGFTETAQEDVSNYVRERALFNEFKSNARDIREKNIENNPEIVKNFKEFEQVLKVNMVRTLYPLQLLSAFHMAFSQNACNFSVPGAGKTTIVFAAYAYLKSLPDSNPKHVDKILIVGPLSSFAPWENEYLDCFGKNPVVVRLSGDKDVTKLDRVQHLFSGNPSELTLISHGGVDRLQEEILSFLRRNKTMVVVDEAHRIKNPEGVWGRSMIEISKEARSRIILTGTPVPNGYEDLFNLFRYLYPYNYTDILGFHYNSLVDMTKNSTLQSNQVKEFIDNISPFFVRIKKSDLKLPVPKDHSVKIVMDTVQREIYDFIENKYVASFKINRYAGLRELLNKARLIRLRQAAVNPALLIKPIKDTLINEDYDSRVYTGYELPDEFQDNTEIISKIKNYSENHVPQKFIEVLRLIKDEVLKNNGKVIIWTVFVQNAKELQKYLVSNEIQTELIIGEIDQVDRELIIHNFNNPENYDFQVLIANPYSVAESISLHKGCHYAIYVERDYNCANFLQSKDRIHRYGLKPGQETNYYYLLSENSIDSVIHGKLNEKVERMEQIIDEDIPLFFNVNESDETDLINALIAQYDKRTK